MSDLPRNLATKVTNVLANEQGIEVTPDEVQDVMVEFLAGVRTKLRAKGFSVPDSDSELMDMMKGAGL